MASTVRGHVIFYCVQCEKTIRERNSHYVSTQTHIHTITAESNIPSGGHVCAFMLNGTRLPEWSPQHTQNDCSYYISDPYSLAVNIILICVCNDHRTARNNYICIS